MGDVVGECGSAIVDADAGIGRGEQHGAARLDIIAVAERAYEIAGDERNGAMA